MLCCADSVFGRGLGQFHRRRGGGGGWEGGPQEDGFQRREEDEERRWKEKKSGGEVAGKAKERLGGRSNVLFPEKKNFLDYFFFKTTA